MANERALPPRRAEKRGTFKDGKWNESRRPRGEHLTHDEILALCDAAGRIGRHRHRDSTLIWVGFVHGLRVAELAGLKLEQYELKANRLTVSRVKNGRTSIHTVEPKERKAVKDLAGDRRTGYVFLTERGTPLTPSGIMKILARAGRQAIDKTGEPVLNFPVHPHMLRHACGYFMNDKGFPIRHIQEWLGHKNIRHTERYAAMSPSAFKGISFDKG
jgi:type 1 fimbriae regulatory protein FimB/type 1 fimbriae regulatory protein FimE